MFGIRSGFYIGVYTIYPFYFFLGYALHKEIVRIPRWLAAVFAGAGIILIPVLTWYAMTYEVTWIQSLTGNYSFVVIVLLAVGIFTLLKATEHPDKENKSGGLVKLIDEQSFGIYLVHMMFLKIGAYVIQWNPYPNGGFFTLLGIAFAVFVCSFVLTYVLRLIPGAKKVL